MSAHSRSSQSSTSPYPKDSATTGTAEGSNHSDARTSRWSRIRKHIREPAAEFFGVMILVIFGNGVNCQTQLSRDPKVASMTFGDYLSVNFGFAVGIALGVWVTEGVSKSHINPAVTIAMAMFRDFPWRMVPLYIFAQIMGGLCGAGIVYANYIHAIDLVEGGRHIRTVLGTAGLFGTYAVPYLTPVSAWFDEFLGTALLLIVVCALSDDARNKRRRPPRGMASLVLFVVWPPSCGMASLVLFVALLGISASFGMQTGFAINPARDLGPRLLTAMVGYGAPVFTFRNHYWLRCPVIAPIMGALVGTFFHDLLFYTGPNSVLNRSDRRAASSETQPVETGSGTA